MKQSIRATGGGVNSAEILTPQEEQVLDIMCPTSMDGHPDILESSVNLLEESDVRLHYILNIVSINYIFIYIY